MSNTIKLAPVVIFAYRRKDYLQRLVASLKICNEFAESQIYLYCDGARSSEDYDEVADVKKFAKSLKIGNIKVILRDRNLGLAKSVISGVSEVLQQHERVIVLEDDLEVTKHFLQFMNAALGFYQEDKNIISISGYAPKSSSQSDVNFSPRAISTGWATWADKWRRVDWNTETLRDNLKDKNFVQKLKAAGADLPRSLKHYQQGSIDSWAVRLVYHQTLNDLVSVIPRRSLVKVGGFDTRASNTSGYSDEFETLMESEAKTTWRFQNYSELNPIYVAEILKRYTLRYRIWYKVMRYLRSR